MTTHKELTLETAAEQAAGWLPHAEDCEVRPERDCTCWQPRVEIMREALEDVMPALLAQAWKKGAKAQEVYESCYRLAVPYGDPMPPTPTNPYTAEAQVDGL